MTDRTMKDVSHTPPNDVSLATVWERGGEEASAGDEDATNAAPADD